MTVSARPLLVGAVGIWKFDDDDATDSSGNENHGAVGLALEFDNDVPSLVASGRSVVGDGTGGNAGLVRVEHSVSLASIVDELSVAFWLKADAASNPNWIRIMRKGNEAMGTNSWIINRTLDQADTLIRIDTTGPGGAFNQNRGNGVGTTAMDGTWHHLVYTLNRGTWREYLDGVETGTGGYPHGNGLANNQPLLLVGRGQNLIGRLDEIGVWNRELSTQEVAEVFNAPLPEAPHSDTWTTDVTVFCVDLELSKTVSITNLLEGTNLTYTIDLFSRSTQTLGGVIVTDTIPPEITFLSSVPIASETNGRRYAFDIGALAPGASTSIVIVAAYTSGIPGVATNWAIALTTNAEANLANNIDSAVTVI
ncbi:MAG: LamG-like jellyroll fold domain-containing protein, partial [Verrucomicrobiota bacterium]